MEASVDVSTPELDSCSGVPVTEPLVGETIGGADETDTWTGRSVLGCVAPRDAVQSDDVCCEVEICRRSVMFGSTVKVWVPLELELKLTELELLNEPVVCWSVVSPMSVL